jgi:hypothetical protein
MNEYGALVEWYWRGKPQYSEEDLSQTHHVAHTITRDLSRPFAMSEAWINII